MSVNTLKVASPLPPCGALAPHSSAASYPPSGLRAVPAPSLPATEHAKLHVARALASSPALVRVAHDLSTWLRAVAGVSVAPVDLQAQLQHSLQAGLSPACQSHDAVAANGDCADRRLAEPSDAAAWLLPLPAARLERPSANAGQPGAAAAPDKYVTSEVAARHLGVSRSHVNALADEGHIKGVLRTPGGHRRLPLKAVLELKQRQTDAPPAAACAPCAVETAQLCAQPAPAPGARWPAGS